MLQLLQVLRIQLPTDPYWFGCPGSGPYWIRIQEHWNLSKQTNKPDFLPFKKAFYIRRYVFWLINYGTLSIFSCKNSTFCDYKVWPGSRYRSAWIRIFLAPWIRIQIRIGIKKRLDPDSHWNQTNADPQHWLSPRTLSLIFHIFGVLVGRLPTSPVAALWWRKF